MISPRTRFGPHPGPSERPLAVRCVLRLSRARASLELAFVLVAACVIVLAWGLGLVALGHYLILAAIRCFVETRAGADRG